jgi:hypothetical protein
MTATSPAPNSLEVSITPRDFPPWLPPMLVKELRQGLRTRGFALALILFQVVMVLLTLGAFATQNTVMGAARASAGTISNTFFWTILGAQMVLITPARAVGGLQLEVDSRTVDLLLLTRLDAWGIVLGKWISLVAQALLLLIAMLPYLVVRYFSDNADLVAEFGDCLALLGGCAVLTAAGLWASALSRILRVVMVILLVIGMQGAAGLFGAMRGPGGFSWVGSFSAVDLTNGALFTSFFLVSAVRNIAPQAENHAFFVRVLPVLALLPAPLLDGLGQHSIAVRQLYVSGVFLAIVLAIELASTRLPMAAQWRDWRRRGPLASTVGIGALPGWPSALLYAVVSGGAWMLLTLLVYPDGTSASHDRADHVVWFAFQLLAGLVFAALLQALGRGGRVEARIAFFTGIIAPVLLTLGAVWLAESRMQFTLARSVMEIVPGASALFAMNPQAFGHPAGVVEPWITALQGMVAVLVLGAAFWVARPYWRLLVAYEIRDRAARSGR